MALLPSWFGEQDLRSMEEKTQSRIEYLLSDKTGTLTYNDMVFKKVSINQTLYSVDDMDELKKGTLRACKKF